MNLDEFSTSNYIYIIHYNSVHDGALVSGTVGAIDWPHHFSHGCSTGASGST